MEIIIRLGKFQENSYGVVASIPPLVRPRVNIQIEEDGSSKRDRMMVIMMARLGKGTLDP